MFEMPVVCAVEHVEVPVEIHNHSAALMAAHLSALQQVQFAHAHRMVSCVLLFLAVWWV